MGRIALFVAAVASLVYLLLEVVVGGLLGVALSRTVVISLSVLIAVILWTAFVWRAGERLGRRDGGAGPRDEGAGRPDDV